jgi:hypothetical protein
MNYTGYVYLYYDTLEKLYYIGGHQGSVEDKYTCSNTTLKGIINRRPNTIRFKVLQYVNGTTNDLRIVEQKWLDLIKPEELYLGKKPKYYNQKIQSSGGNGYANKGNSKIGGHNRISWKIISPEGVEIITDKLTNFAEENNLSKDTLYSSYKNNRKVLRGPSKGWQMLKA